MTKKRLQEEAQGDAAETRSDPDEESTDDIVITGGGNTEELEAIADAESEMVEIAPGVSLSSDHPRVAHQRRMDAAKKNGDAIEE